MTGGEVAGDGTDGVGVGPNWPRCKTGAQIYDARGKRKKTDMNIPCQPLTDAQGGEAHKDEAFDEDSSQGDLEWDHT